MTTNQERINSAMAALNRAQERSISLRNRINVRLDAIDGDIDQVRQLLQPVLEYHQQQTLTEWNWRQMNLTAIMWENEDIRQVLDEMDWFEFIDLLEAAQKAGVNIPLREEYLTLVNEGNWTDYHETIMRRVMVSLEKHKHKTNFNKVWEYMKMDPVLIATSSVVDVTQAKKAHLDLKKELKQENAA